MNHSAALVLYELSAVTTARWYGATKSICLNRPELYAASRPLTSGHLYIGSTDMLPAMPQFSDKMLVICVGSVPSSAYLRGKFPFIHVPSGKLIDVFNLVQDTFNRYENWNRAILEEAKNTGDIVEMLRLSMPIFCNPMIIVDAKLQNIASVKATKNANGALTLGNVERLDGPLDIAEFLPYMATHQNNMKKRGVFSPENDAGVIEEETYCINIFVNDKYAGNITLKCVVQPFQDNWKYCLESFAEAIAIAMKHHSSAIVGTDYTMHSVIVDILNGNPVSQTRLRLATSSNTLLKETEHEVTPQYLCVTLAPRATFNAPSFSFVCNIIEQAIADSTAVEFESTIVCVINMSAADYTTKELSRVFVMLLEELRFQVGVSNPFCDMQKLKIYYRQACQALEIGSEYDNAAIVYHFKDYLMTYLLKNALGEFKVRDVCPAGILELQKLDKKSAAGYWQTLQVCLKNNFNIAQTARDLYLSRSTLLARLEKINSVLEMDIDNAEQRTLIQLFVRMIDLEQK